jgi:RNA polymerase sigma-70 factor (ECF subfamily)
MDPILQEPLIPKMESDPSNTNSAPKGVGETPSSQFPSDREVILRIQHGETDLFDLIIERYKTRIYSVIYNMLSNHEDAADLSQEIFVKAFKALPTFRVESHFYTWLYRITINSGLNFIRRRKTPHLSLNEFDSGVEDEPIVKELASKESTTQNIDLNEIQEKLNESLQKLSKEHRAVVVLHDIEGMKHQDIAKVLNCSEATARSRLFYAHQQLQALLAKYI